MTAGATEQAHHDATTDELDELGAFREIVPRIVERRVDRLEWTDGHRSVSSCVHPTLGSATPVVGSSGVPGT